MEREVRQDIRKELFAIAAQFSSYDVRCTEDGNRLDIINPFGKDPIRIHVENDPDTPYMVCFSFQHRHLATIDEVIAYASDIIGGNVFAIEFFKDGRNFMGSDLDAKEVRELPQGIPERFLGQGQIKLFDVADSFKVRGWGKGADLDGRFIKDEQGNVRIQINPKILGDT